RGTEKTNYVYDNLHRLHGVSISDQHKSYEYDDFDRIKKATDVVGENKIFTRSIEYDRLGRVYKETYPSGYVITNIYDSYSYLTSVKDVDNRTIWAATESNAHGQLTKTQSGGKTTTFGFDSRGFPTSIVTQGITNLAYSFDAKGNLEYRQDRRIGYKESFAYDDKNRLTDWDDNFLTYDANGNIAKKSDLGDFTLHYGAEGRPHALDSISGVPSFMSNEQKIDYTDFKKVKKVAEDGNVLNISYGTDEQRIKSVLTKSGTSLTRYYMGNYEEETQNGVTRQIHYISGGNGLAAVLIDNTLYYAHTDFQGSLIALSNEDGSVAERYAYDPWGNRRNPTNWAQRDTRTAFILSRGYTMHEHLDDFALINMNGRVYDPLTAQFFSPDPYLQAPGDWLNYNRYAYCMNNPFKYTDPSGEIAWFIPVIIG
ncbi:RHS repeat domain-containing protein, partial [Candidatus Symbiothrix dinenymphae]|uniref:RHS repeat domain-containing protein n=1 Tax=Candidatus Symbiothrix dinenymphae TaxID=467085 RepID=UPI002714C83B